MSRPLPLAVAFMLTTSPTLLGAQAPASGRTVYDDLQMFSQVLNQIRVNHADSMDVHELFMAAIQGMVRSADPHSFVLMARRDVSERERQLREGKLHPVPIEFEFVRAAPLVVNVVPGTRAVGLDILPGDELVGIDTAAVRSLGAGELEVELAGPRGSSVTLKLDRRRTDGSVAHLERKVRRERVQETSAVVAPLMLDARTGYVRLTSFLSDRLVEDLRGALKDLERRGMQRLVLDLRDNGGGAIGQAATVAGAFLPEGTVIYTTEGRKRDVVDTGRVDRSASKAEKRYPIVALVNDGTASAAELLAGALQDHDRGLVVGTPTFGKSLIMRPFPLADGSIIVLVVGRLRTPCGRLIQRPYQDITTREYYRTAGMARDTAGLPSCRTTHGRTVYGGRGLLPDVFIPEPAPRPLWLSRLFEEDLPLQWVGAYLADHRAALGTLETFERNPRLPTDPAADFRAFARRHDVEIPQTEDADDTLRGLILTQMAVTAFGTEGLYRIAAKNSSHVAAAVAAFDRAESLLK